MTTQQPGKSLQLINTFGRTKLCDNFFRPRHDLFWESKFLNSSRYQIWNMMDKTCPFWSVPWSCSFTHHLLCDESNPRVSTKSTCGAWLPALDTSNLEETTKRIHCSKESYKRAADPKAEIVLATCHSVPKASLLFKSANITSQWMRNAFRTTVNNDSTKTAPRLSSNVSFTIQTQLNKILPHTQIWESTSDRLLSCSKTPDRQKFGWGMAEFLWSQKQEPRIKICFKFSAEIQKQKFQNK